ncbi:MAG: ABC transporter permease, partial [Dokdonella sp.]
MKPLRFAARTLRREIRHGELVTLAIALVLAITALTAVGTLASRVEHAIVASAAELIGGDLSIGSREALPPKFAERASADGLRSNALAEFPSVVFAGDHSQFCDVRASDAAFPLRGTLTVRGRDGAVAVAHAPPPGQVYVDARVLAALAQPIGGT